MHPNNILGASASCYVLYFYCGAGRTSLFPTILNHMTMIQNNKTSNHGFAINDIVSIIYIYICFNKVGINVPIVTNNKVESTNKIFEDLFIATQ
jgi:hypothetical protein